MESVLYLSVYNRPIRLEAARGIIRQVLKKIELGLATFKSNVQKLELWHTWLTSFRMITVRGDLSNLAAKLPYCQILAT